MSPKSKTAAAAGAGGAESETVAAPLPGEPGYKPVGELKVLAKNGKTRVVSDDVGVWKETAEEKKSA